MQSFGGVIATFLLSPAAGQLWGKELSPAAESSAGILALRQP